MESGGRKGRRDGRTERKDLPQLLSMEDAAFRTAGSTKEDKAIAAIAKQMRSTGNASLQAMQEPAVRVLLYELAEGARVRNLKLQAEMRLMSFVVWLVSCKPSGRYISAETARKYVGEVIAWMRRVCEGCIRRISQEVWKCTDYEIS